MAKNTLPTNYVDDIMNVSANGNRKYRMIYNDDGTVSFEDVTPYEQVGSDYSAIDINTTNEAVNESFDKNKIVPDLTTINALTEQGYVPDALSVKQLSESFASGMVNVNTYTSPEPGSYVDIPVLFNKTLSDNPIVTTNIVVSSGNNAYSLLVPQILYTSVSQNGFTIRLWNNSNVAIAARINWTAIV